MIISNYSKYIKGLSKKSLDLLTQKETIVSLLIIVTSILAFLIGFAAGKEGGAKRPQVIFTDVDRAGLLAAVTVGAESFSNSGQVNDASLQSNKKTTIFGSKSGTKYYFSWCKSGNRIKQANRVYFETSARAESAGRTIAANCK